MDKISFAASTVKVQISFSHTFNDFKKIVTEKIKEVGERLEDFTAQGSNWTLSEIVFIDLTFSTLGGMKGGCFFKYPVRRGLLNIESNDNLCLVYCVAAFLHQKAIAAGLRNKGESYRKYLPQFKLKGLNFPMHPAEVEDFENANDHLGFQINIFIEEDGDVFPYKSVTHKDGLSTINVLLVEGLTTSNQKVYHYILITDPGAFLQKNTSVKMGTRVMTQQKGVSNASRNSHHQICLQSMKKFVKQR